MIEAAVIGASGFVGSAFVARLSCLDGVNVHAVTRASYADHRRRRLDVVIDCSGNSRKYLADQDPVDEFDRSAAQRLRTLQDFPAALQVHVSSVDVYSDLGTQDTTREEAPIDVARASHYGFHKLVSEDLVRHYAPRWLIVRLAGMVGPGLKKNPVFDVLNGQPLRIHPDSRYQFMHTHDVADAVWDLVSRRVEGEIFNICGRGLVSPRGIAAMAGRELDLTHLAPTAVPRVVDVSTVKIEALRPMPETEATVRRFVGEAPPASTAGRR